MTTYKTVRMFFLDRYPDEVTRTGLTLEEAQEHCRDPETSSRTCASEAGLLRTISRSKWFEGYEEEK